jgi:HTH-type transcriptional regulator/antitoxin HipB
MVDVSINDWQKMGATLRAARRDHGLSQQALADRAGVSRAWLARFETGHRHAEMEQVFRVLNALDLSLAVKPVERPAGENAVLAALAQRASR